MGEMALSTAAGSEPNSLLSPRESSKLNNLLQNHDSKVSKREVLEAIRVLTLRAAVWLLIVIFSTMESVLGGYASSV